MPTLFAGIPVAGYPATRSWYERFVGREADMLPNDNEACWQLSGDGWIYVVGDEARAGRALVTLIVDDLDARLAALAGRGIDPVLLDTLSSGVRTAEFVDPDGNRLKLGQVPG